MPDSCEFGASFPMSKDCFDGRAGVGCVALEFDAPAVWPEFVLSGWDWRIVWLAFVSSLLSEALRGRIWAWIGATRA